jgi:hypothetical protein
VVGVPCRLWLREDSLQPWFAFGDPLPSRRSDDHDLTEGCNARYPGALILIDAHGGIAMFSWWGRSKRESPPAKGPDFSGIDSHAKAEAAAARGELERLYLLPLEFGGAESTDNFVFVPIGVADIKAGIDQNIILPLVEQEKVSQYVAKPEYRGRSVVPIAVTIKATDPGQFSTVINIWGEALERE